MPVFVVDGRRYKVPFKSLFNGNKNVCKHIMADKVSTYASLVVKALTSSSAQTP